MNRGEIWLVDLDPTIGAEMNKTRPALLMEKIGVITSDEINKVQDGILKVLGI